MKEGLRSITRNEGSVEGEGEGRKEDEVVVGNLNNEIELKCNNGEESGTDGSLDAIVVLEETIACKVTSVGKNDGYSVLFSRVNDNGEEVGCVDARKCDNEQGGGVSTGNCNGEKVDNVQTKGRRGRKRKSPQMSSIGIEGSVEGVGKKDDEVVLVNVTNEIEMKSNSCEELDCNGSLDVPELRDEEETKNLDSSLPVGLVNDNRKEVDDGNDNDCDGEQVDCVDVQNCNDNVNNGNGEQEDNVQTKGRRGRKSPHMSSIRITGSVEVEGKKDDEVVLVNVTNEIELKSNHCEELGCNGSLDVPELRDEEETKNLDSRLLVGRGNDNYCDGEQVDRVDAQDCNDNVNNGNGEQEDNVQTKGRRGRKRKSPPMSSIRIEGSVEGEGKKDDEVVLANVSNEIELKSNSFEESGCNGSSDAILVPELRVDEETKYLGSSLPVRRVNVNVEEVDDVNANNCNGELGAGVDANNCKPGQEDGGSADNCNGEQANADNANNGNGEQAGNGTKGRRGRKRKSPQISSNAQMAEMTDGASTDNCNGVQQANDDNANNGNGEQADNGTKGRRGRKRKSPQMAKMIDLNEMPVVQLSGRVLRSRTVAVRANDLVEGDLCDVDDKIDEGIDEVDNKIKLENVEDKGAEPSRRGKKEKNKDRPGRPPQVNLESEDADVTIEKKYKVLGSKQSMKSGTSVSKVKGGSVASEKKDIRNKVVDMVIQCGWKLELVPRISKDYRDPVYVDPEGKTHWSITKAYKRLKERIDSGEANAVERAGFIVVPDETLSKLFRVTTKKRSDCGVKRSVEVEVKESGRNRSSSKKTDDSNCKEKLNIGQKSCGRKRKSVPFEGRKKRRFALLARGSRNRSDQDDGDDDDESELYNKKRNLLSWMIDLGTVPEGENVQYRDTVNGEALLEGKVTHDGLSCNCCNEMHTILGFQLHAGNKLGEPLKNIYLGSGPTIFQSMVDSWSQQVELSKIGFCTVNVASSDHSDDTCNICGDGGNLMCCDCCPSTFHLSCLDIEDVPAGDWHCMYCTCKFCGSVGDEALSQDDGNQLITCQLCEEKFHSTCTGQTDAESMKSTTASFCGTGCQKIFNRLQKFVGLKHEMEGGLSWTILQRYDVDNDGSLSDYPLKIECNAKLAVAYSVMDECFFPVVDPRSQSEMISNVIYNCGSNFRRLNYSGFYTFILEKGDEVVSTASIRFHGAQLAEMPFIATRNIYRRQGFSRQLLIVIEKALSSMDIQKLIIPAVSDVMAMWTDSFGFMPLEEATWREMKTMSVIVFPHTDMLQKPLLRPTESEGEPSFPEVQPVTLSDPESEMVDVVADEQAGDCSEQKGEEGM